MVSGLMGSKMIGYQVIGATPEQCHGEGIPVKDGLPISTDNEKLWWEKRHERMEELMEEQEKVTGAESAVTGAVSEKPDSKQAEATEFSCR